MKQGQSSTERIFLFIFPDAYHRPVLLLTHIDPF
jgi:hypothetical protein